MTALKRTMVSIYLEKENYDKLKILVKRDEDLMSRWLAKKLVKLIDKELLKREKK